MRNIKHLKCIPQQQPVLGHKQEYYVESDYAYDLLINKSNAGYR